MNLSDWTSRYLLKQNPLKRLPKLKGSQPKKQTPKHWKQLNAQKLPEKPPQHEQPKRRPLNPNEDCGLFICPEKGFCYFLIKPEAAYIYEVSTKDWAYWNQVIMEIARLCGCGYLRTFTKRNPLAMARLTNSRINVLLSGLDENNENIWCLEKEVV